MGQAQVCLKPSRWSDLIERLTPGCWNRCIVVANRLPLKVSKTEAGEWQFDWDEDALIFQAKVWDLTRLVLPAEGLCSRLNSKVRA